MSPRPKAVRTEADEKALQSAIAKAAKAAKAEAAEKSVGAQLRQAAKENA